MAKSKPTQVLFCKDFPFPAEHYELLTSFTVNGEPGRKSNGRRIVHSAKTGKMLVIKSEKAMAYEESFMAQVTPEYRLNVGSPSEPLALWVKIYYGSNRPDVSSELLQDLLQKAGVVANDRYFKATLAFGAIDTVQPHTEIRIYRVL